MTAHQSAKDSCHESLSALSPLDVMESQSEAELDLGVMPHHTANGDATCQNDVILRIECITERQMKV